MPLAQASQSELSLREVHLAHELELASCGHVTQQFDLQGLICTPRMCAAVSAPYPLRAGLWLLHLLDASWPSERTFWLGKGERRSSDCQAA